MPRVVVIPSNPPSPIPSDLRTALTTALLATSAVQNIHQTLLSSCTSTGWLDKAGERAVQLLKNGECATYDEVMDVLIAEARGKACSEEIEGIPRRRINNGISHGKGKQKELDIRVPERTIAEGVKVVKEALDRVVKIEGGEERWS